MAGKKGKKGKKGKQGKKGKKEKKVQMSPQEAILAYQINVAEEKLEDILYEIKGWEDKNSRNLQRNIKLKQEQADLLRDLLKTNREQPSMHNNDEVSSKDEVCQVMKENWNTARQHTAQIQEIKMQLVRVDSEIQSVEQEVKSWQLFRDQGQHELKLHIRVLELEMEDMEASIQDMIARLRQDKDKTLRQIEEHTQEVLSQQKDRATQKAVSQLDNCDRQEVQDSSWLSREVSIQRRQNEMLCAVVEKLEEENLQLMGQLFECSVDDLKVSRSFFLTQFDEDCENLDTAGILELDLANLTVPERPRSAVQKAVENKVLSLNSTLSSHDDDGSDDGSYDGCTKQESESDVHDNFYFEEEDFEDYLKLGPLELKLLCVTGQQMPIHHMEPPTQEETTAQQWNPDMWPVTQPMLRDLLVHHQ